MSDIEYSVITSDVIKSSDCIHEYANYANKVRCIFDHGMKGLCLSFILVQI